MSSTTLRARYVFPGDGPPIADGCVTYDADRIVAVGPAPSAASADDVNVVDLGSVALLPGLINAHTHLELSSVPAPLGRARQSLPDWLATVLQQRANGDYDREAAVQAGLAESLRYGVTGLADIVQEAAPRQLRSQTSVAQLALKELIALAPELADVRRDEAATFLDAANHATAAAGLSPHAPYTVRPELLQAAVALALPHGATVAMYLAESPEEIELLSSGGGPFQQFLAARGVWRDGIFGHRRPLDELTRLAEAPRALVIHGNYLDAEEIDCCAAHADRRSVIYCPRTHAYFGHAPHPLPRLLAQGANVAVGTDSRASNPDLDLLAELRHVAHTVPEIAPHEILALGTSRAARALGWAKDCGTLAPGKLANLAVVPLDARREGAPFELLFDAESRSVATIVRGHLAYGALPVC